MLTDKNYCDYEACIALKEVGFNEYCNGYIDSLCKTFIETRYLKKWNSYKRSDFEIFSCPSLYEAQKWLREKHNLHIEITYSPSCWTCKIYDLKEWDYIKGFTFIESYEEALLEGIKESIKILKDM